MIILTSVPMIQFKQHTKHNRRPDSIVKLSSRLLKRGTLTKVSNKHGSLQLRQFVLFNDIFIYGSNMSVSTGSKPKYRHRRTFQLSGASVEDVMTDDIPTLKALTDLPVERIFMFRIKSEEKSFLVLAPTRREKQMWICALSKAIKLARGEAGHAPKTPRSGDKTLVSMSSTSASDDMCAICERTFSNTIAPYFCAECGTDVCRQCSPPQPDTYSGKRLRKCKACEEASTVCSLESEGEGLVEGATQSLVKVLEDLSAGEVSVDVDGGNDDSPSAARVDVAVEGEANDVDIDNQSDSSFDAADVCRHSWSTRNQRAVSADELLALANAAIVNSHPDVASDARRKSAIVINRTMSLATGQDQQVHKQTPTRLGGGHKRGMTSGGTGLEQQKHMSDSLKDVRTMIMNEIVQTERTYVRNMNFLTQVFIDPLIDDHKSGRAIIGGDIASVINKADNTAVLVFFSQIPQITSVASNFLADLTTRSRTWNEDASTLGDLFTYYATMLKTYDEYSSTYAFVCKVLSKAIETTPELQQFITSSTQKHATELGTQSLESLLILPVQRVPRYLMLLKELLKYTPAGHPDFLLLEEAVETVSAVATHINESIRAQENLVKMYELQQEWGDVVYRSLPKANDANEGACENGQGEEDRDEEQDNEGEGPKSTNGGSVDAVMNAENTTTGTKKASSSTSVWNALNRMASVKMVDATQNSNKIAGATGTATAGNKTDERWFVLEGDLIKQSRRSRVLYKFVLFNDVLMYGSKDGRAGGVKHHRTIALRNSEVDALEEENQMASNENGVTTPTSTAGSHKRRGSKGSERRPSKTELHAFELRSPQKSFRVFAESQSLKNQWVSKLQACIREASDDDESKRPASYPPRSSGLVRRASLSAKSMVNIVLHRRSSRAKQETSETTTKDSSLTKGDAASAASASTSTSTDQPKRIQSTKTKVAPVWVHDADARECAVCTVKFTLVRRRHHCRSCGRVICDSCSTHRMLLANIDKKALLRVCDPCFTPSESTDVVNQNSMRRRRKRKSATDVMFDVFRRRNWPNISRPSNKSPSPPSHEIQTTADTSPHSSNRRRSTVGGGFGFMSPWWRGGSGNDLNSAERSASVGGANNHAPRYVGGSQSGSRNQAQAADSHHNLKGSVKTVANNEEQFEWIASDDVNTSEGASSGLELFPTPSVVASD
jgi:hypothetical protein